MLRTNQTVKIISCNGEKGLKTIEYAGRNCYASQDKITDKSYVKFIKNLIANGHDSPLEFADMVVDITTSRAVLAEITRHRLASFCVESQRYIQEAKTGDITFIIPEWISQEKDEYWTANPDFIAWRDAMLYAENAYKHFIAAGRKPEEAREVLPNSTACRIIMKANLREWRHIFKLRTSRRAYPQMRSLMLQLLEKAKEAYPGVFDDINIEATESVPVWVPGKTVQK